MAGSSVLLTTPLDCRFVLNPLRNPLKEVLDSGSSVRETPPLVGIFNDIPVCFVRSSALFVESRELTLAFRFGK